MAMGSVPPLLRFQPDGTSGRGPAGIQGPPLEAKVGAPLELTLWLTDDAVHEKEPIPVGTAGLLREGWQPDAQDSDA
jgi:hypothetical protein